MGNGLAADINAETQYQRFTKAGNQRIELLGGRAGRPAVAVASPSLVTAPPIAASERATPRQPAHRHRPCRVQSGVAGHALDEPASAVGDFIGLEDTVAITIHTFQDALPLLLGNRAGQDFASDAVSSQPVGEGLGAVPTVREDQHARHFRLLEQVEEKVELARFLEEETFDGRFSRLLEHLQTDELSLEDITQEVETVRRQRYEQTDSSSH